MNNPPYTRFDNSSPFYSHCYTQSCFWYTLY